MKIIDLNAYITERFSGQREALMKCVCSGPRRFVLQKYVDRNYRMLRYDLRLEFEGTFKSWTIPQGPSMQPQEPRTAFRIADAPHACLDFEGMVPLDEFGGGTVLVWDLGEWISQSDPRSAFKAGTLHFKLKGCKLQGDWSLASLKEEPCATAHAWRLTKLWDRAAAANIGDILTRRPESVLSGRLIEHIIAQSDALPV